MHTAPPKHSSARLPAPGGFADQVLNSNANGFCGLAIARHTSPGLQLHVLHSPSGRPHHQIGRISEQSKFGQEISRPYQEHVTHQNSLAGSPHWDRPNVGHFCAAGAGCTLFSWLLCEALASPGFSWLCLFRFCACVSNQYPSPTTSSPISSVLSMIICAALQWLLYSTFFASGGV